ncbi:hypothetical protein [Mycobacterium sp. M23085]|uniref:hypothetical protein n=1 Tax=Mycobacterium sp. M23085 TaxID=3378087 RepID=UPI0038783D38
MNPDSESASGLGDQPAFKWWSGRRRPWGEQDLGWQAWFGGKVVDGLCDLLDEHLEQHKQGAPAVIGCVPWFDSKAVEDRLLKMRACCIVMDKGSWLPGRLVRAGIGFPNIYLPGLQWTTAEADEDGTWIGPYTSMPEHLLGPVRVLGWGKREKKPLLHAKMMVLGAITDFYHDVDGYGEHHERYFVPDKVWFGSANWTNLSRSHLEVGVVFTDHEFISEAQSFVADLIGFSEPVDTGTTHAGPKPNLVYMQFDDAAMSEAAEEMRSAHLEELAEAEDQPDTEGPDW